MKTNKQAGHVVFEALSVATPDEVRSARAIMGLSQAELAGEMGVTEFTVWRWEHGKRPITVPHTRLLRKLYEDHASRPKPTR